jgi:arsenate reductase (thioredoxin)
VRLLGDDASLGVVSLGVMSRDEALARARDAGVDLVEVNPKSSPPTCRLIDMSRYGFEKHERENVLFVCLHNSARSQMAAAFLARATKDVIVESAGTHAAERVHPLVIEAMREVGIDLLGRAPRQLDPLLVGCATIIVRCLAPDPDDYAWGNCTARFIDWELPMPPDEDNPTLDEIRTLRDAIERRVSARRPMERSRPRSSRKSFVRTSGASSSVTRPAFETILGLQVASRPSSSSIAQVTCPKRLLIRHPTCRTWTCANVSSTGSRHSSFRRPKAAL